VTQIITVTIMTLIISKARAKQTGHSTVDLLSGVVSNVYNIQSSWS